jgi:NLI interacting factor-like phosphatase
MISESFVISQKKEQQEYSFDGTLEPTFFCCYDMIIGCHPEGSWNSNLVASDDFRLRQQIGDFPNRCVGNPADIPPADVPFFLTVVLDLDETLISSAADGRAIKVRMYTRSFLENLCKLNPRVEIIAWSAGHRTHVNRCLHILDPDSKIFHHAICRDASWMDDRPGTSSIVLKNLYVLPRNQNRIVLIDDSTFASVCNGPRAIIVPKACFSSSEDDMTLINVFHVIKDGIISNLAKHEYEECVSTHVKSHAFIANEIVYAPIGDVHCCRLVAQP